MKQTFNVYDIIILSALFVTALYVWSLPFQNNPLPFGEGDAAWHFGIGDYIAQQDRSIVRLPDHIGFWYYNFNPVLGPNAPEYPPPNHLNYAFANIAGGERFVPVNIYKAIASFLSVLAVYYLLRQFYSPAVAAVAGFGTMFGFREMLMFVFGQQPTLISLTFMPIVLVAYHKFLTSYFEGKAKLQYLVITGLLLAVIYLLHIQGLVVIIPLALYTLFLLIKYRKLSITRPLLITAGATTVAVLILTVPFYLIYTGGQNQFQAEQDPGRLFKWGVDYELQAGSFPQVFFDLSRTYPIILLYLIPLAFIALLLRRSDSNLLILSWFSGVYIILHLDVFTGLSIARITRYHVFETPLFYAFISIGAFYLLQTALASLKISNRAQFVARYVLAAGLIAFIFVSVGQPAIESMENQYTGVSRISPAQLQAADWMRINLPEGAILQNVGTISYAKMRFIYTLGHRFMASNVDEFEKTGPPTHFFVDMSDRAGDPAFMQQIQAYEQSLQNTTVLLYNQANIRIYEVQ